MWCCTVLGYRMIDSLLSTIIQYNSSLMSTFRNTYVIYVTYNEHIYSINTSFIYFNLQLSQWSRKIVDCPRFYGGHVTDLCLYLSLQFFHTIRHFQTRNFCSSDKNVKITKFFWYMAYGVIFLFIACDDIFCTCSRTCIWFLDNGVFWQEIGTSNLYTTNIL